MIAEFKPTIDRLTISTSEYDKQERKLIDYYTTITISESKENFNYVVSYKDRKGEEYIRI